MTTEELARDVERVEAEVIELRVRQAATDVRVTRLEQLTYGTLGIGFTAVLSQVIQLATHR